MKSWSGLYHVVTLGIGDYAIVTEDKIAIYEVYCLSNGMTFTQAKKAALSYARNDKLSIQLEINRLKLLKKENI